MERMTVKRADSLRKPGRYRAGDTLYLVISRTGSRSWIQRITVRGRRRDVGLGSYRMVGLSEARDRAWENLKSARSGGDPAPRAARIPTFRAAAAAVAKASEWRGPRTAANRSAAFETYCGGIMDRRVDQIDRAAILALLAPIWIEKPAMARILRGWIRGVLSWAEGHGHVPANVAGTAIDGALPKRNGATHHHEAVRYQDLPATLRAVESSGAGLPVRACLRLIVLTAARSSEARLARWSEVDTDAATWTIPAGRMKMGAAHRVPLSRAALAVLESMRPFRDGSDWVFPGSGAGEPLSTGALLMALRRIVGPTGTVHGFRASFRTWASELTAVPHAVCEAALAHRVGGDVILSYARSDHFDQRRQLMADWSDYICA